MPVSRREKFKLGHYRPVAEGPDIEWQPVDIEPWRLGGKRKKRKRET